MVITQFWTGFLKLHYYNIFNVVIGKLLYCC